MPNLVECTCFIGRIHILEILCLMERSCYHFLHTAYNFYYSSKVDLLYFNNLIWDDVVDDISNTVCKQFDLCIIYNPIYLRRTSPSNMSSVKTSKFELLKMFTFSIINSSSPVNTVIFLLF